MTPNEFTDPTPQPEPEAAGQAPEKQPSDTTPPAEAPPAGPGHNSSNKLANLSPEDFERTKVKAGNIIRSLADDAEERGGINQRMSAKRAELADMGFNKKAIKHAEALELARRADNMNALSGFFPSARILSAAIGVPMDKDGQFGFNLDEVPPPPPTAMTKTTHNATEHIPNAPGRAKKEPAPKMKGPPLGPNDVDLQEPLTPDTIKCPPGVTVMDFTESIIRGRVAFRRGVERTACPDELAGALGDLWEKGWDYEEALQGGGPGNAAAGENGEGDGPTTVH